MMPKNKRLKIFKLEYAKFFKPYNESPDSDNLMFVFHKHI